MGAQRLMHQRNVVLKLLFAFFTAVLLLYLLTDVQLQVPPPRRPPPAMYHDEPLLNLTNFHLVTSPYACQSREEVKALLLITSHSGNVHARMAWRNGMPTQVCVRCNKFHFLLKRSFPILLAEGIYLA
jgi:hypothetical protein